MNTGTVAPIFSIIVPVYNVERYLEKCLTSIANQTLKDIEVIIINDGSTDNSLEICELFSKKYKNFYLFTKSNEGQGVARNFGLDKSRGQYIIFVDSDDWIDENLCKDTEALMRASLADFGNFGLDFIGEEGNVIKKFTYFNKAPYYDKEIFHKALLDDGILSVSGNKVYKRSLLRENGIYFPPIRANEDIYFSRAVAQSSRHCIFIDKIYYHALVRTGSTSRKMSTGIYYATKSLIDYEENHFDLVDSYTRQLFNAHIVKLWTYLLIQGCFRVDGEDEFSKCLDIANEGYFGKYSASKKVTKHLNLKNRFLAFLCRHPKILRFSTGLAAKFKIFPY